MDDPVFCDKYSLGDLVFIIDLRIFNVLMHKAAVQTGKIIMTDLEHALCEKLFKVHECGFCGKLVGFAETGHICSSKNEGWVQNPNWRE